MPLPPMTGGTFRTYPMREDTSGTDRHTAGEKSPAHSRGDAPETHRQLKRSKIVLRFSSTSERSAFWGRCEPAPQSLRGGVEGVASPWDRGRSCNPPARCRVVGRNPSVGERPRLQSWVALHLRTLLDAGQPLRRDGLADHVRRGLAGEELDDVGYLLGDAHPALDLGAVDLVGGDAHL